MIVATGADRRVALVTGGAERVGRVLSLALARAGFDIALNHWERAAAAGQTNEDIAALGRRCLVLEADVADPSEGQGLVDAVEERFGRLDVLVHNASNFHECPLLEVTEAVWDSSLGVNLKGPFFLSQAAARLMLRQGSGRIIALVGNSYYESWPTFAAHSIAKTGLAKLMQILAVGLSPSIQCNAVCPARIFPSPAGQDLRLMQARNEDPEGASSERSVALRQGTPDDVAELVVYLASCSSYLTGAIIPVDGGKSAL